MRNKRGHMMCLWLLTACLGVAPVQPNYVYYPVINGAIVTPNGAPPPIVVPTAPPTPPPTAPPTVPPTLPPTPPPTTLPPTTPPPTTLPPTTPPPTTPPPTTPPPTTPPPTTLPPTPPPTTPPPTTQPPTTPPTTRPPTTPFPLIDPRAGSEAPLKMIDVELVRFGGVEYQDVVIEPDPGGNIAFPREKRSIQSDRLRRRRQTNCGCFLPTQCPVNATAPPNTDGSGLIDFRIVVSANNIPTCVTGLKYCCVTPSPQQSCGSRLQTSIIYPTQPGQARYGDYPWMVVILTNDNLYVGGAVLIDMQHVLTVAHRITGYPNGTGIKIRLGEWDASGNYEQYPYRDFSISRVWIHESYNPNSLQNDVALIRITGGVPVGTPAVVPICMPAAGQVFDGQRCWVAGWGKDSFGVTGQYQTVLKTVDVPILPPATCETTLRTTRLGAAYILDRAAFICAGGELNKDACTGDGGSGLVCETSPGRWTLAGLVAWGLGCASQGIPAAYVNVANYLPWISSKQAMT